MSQPESYPPAQGGQNQSPAAAEPAAPATSQTVPEPNDGEHKPAKTIVGPRRVRLALTRVDPWSVMKASFLLSVAAGIMLVVAAAFVWFMLDAMHVFSTIQDLVGTVMDSSNNAYSALIEYMKFSRAISMATVIAVVNIILMTALATIGAFLYNITAALVGGVHLTLADE
ncbi:MULTISPECIES: DUF3566 domain-containing protein [unclassified Actinomyces]|uniref:DUF3566 domain-containing protein n=1 Tax=unclassified Actinomyces TaxID=2609248 RepID=UPI0013A6AF7F|nr:MULTISPECIES: DUF3566 domain-containing protein [unclassified Actinomyces]MBW3069807.1 DUF3566 domain-containing protein [Actinomyces sp. 594]NDR54148.1 DUF3566 domain-containing protein [Actinomyces sp. 565]